MTLKLQKTEIIIPTHNFRSLGLNYRTSTRKTDGVEDNSRNLLERLWNDYGT